jgi:hypothetical protein
MQVLQPSQAGKVVAMAGKAVARGHDGQLRLIAIGDWIASDEVIVTGQNGFVELAFGDAPARGAELATVAALGTVGRASFAPKVVGGPQAADSPAPSSEAGEGGLSAALRVDALSTDARAVPPASASAAAADAPLAAARIAAEAPAVDRVVPVADGARLSVAEDQVLPLALTGRDPGGRIAAVWVVKVPTGGVLYTADGDPIADRTALTPAQAATLQFHPAPDFHGNPGPLQFLLVDRIGRHSAVASVGIDVIEVNDAPRPGTVPRGPDFVAIDDPDLHHLTGTPDYRYVTTPGTAVAGAVAATDVDLDPLRFTTQSGPAHGSLALGADGSFVYTPEAGYRGADRFVVGVDDGRGGSATSTVFVDVGPGAGVAAAGVDAKALATPTLGEGATGVAAALVAPPAAESTASAAPVQPAVMALTADAHAWSLAEPAPTPFAAPAGVGALLAADLLDTGHGLQSTLRSALGGSHDTPGIPPANPALGPGLDLGFLFDGGRGALFDPLRAWPTPAHD